MENESPPLDILAEEEEGKNSVIDASPSEVGEII